MTNLKQTKREIISICMYKTMIEKQITSTAPNGNQWSADSWLRTGSYKCGSVQIVWLHQTLSAISGVTINHKTTIKNKLKRVWSSDLNIQNSIDSKQIPTYKPLYLEQFVNDMQVVTKQKIAQVLS